VLPMGLSWYLEGMSGDQSFTPERLAAITVTSPFSAALGVPMHTSRIENWTGQSLNVSPAVLVQLTHNIALPVWAIFLAIYPPLSLVFMGISYLAFRWRWWKAGNSG